MWLSAVFVFGAGKFRPRRMRYEKPAPKTGARKWSRFMAPVSGACVMGLRQLGTATEPLRGSSL